MNTRISQLLRQLSSHRRNGPDRLYVRLEANCEVDHLTFDPIAYLTLPAMILKHADLQATDTLAMYATRS